MSASCMLLLQAGTIVCVAQLVLSMHRLPGTHKVSSKRKHTSLALIALPTAARDPKNGLMTVQDESAALCQPFSDRDANHA